MIRHILIALDGSELTERAIDSAKTILDPQAKITLVTAVPDGEANDDTVSEVTSYLERIAMNLKLNGYDAQAEVRIGVPAVIIVEVAIAFGVEMIVIGTHGRSGISRLLFGSVTTEVLNTTPCPVLVIPNREQVRVDEPAVEEAIIPDLDAGLAQG